MLKTAPPIHTQPLKEMRGALGAVVAWVCICASYERIPCAHQYRINKSASRRSADFLTLHS